MNREDRNTSIWFPSLKAAVATALIAGLLAAVIDLVRAMIGSRHPLDVSVAAGLLVGLAGFYLLCGLAVGLMEGVVIAAAREFRIRVLKTGPVWKTIKESDESDSTWAAGLLAGVSALAVPALTIYLIHTGFSSRFADRSLAAVFLGGVAVGSSAAGIALFFPLFSLARRLMEIVPRIRLVPKTLLAAALIIAAGVGVFWFMLTRAAWRMIDFGPYLALAQLLLLQALTWLALRKLGDRAGRTLTSWPVPLTASLLCVGALVYSADAFNKSQTLRAAAMDRSWAGPVFLKLGRAVTDDDGDGFSEYFGGGDCDDSNPRVHPGRRDIPGDGVDQDCLGGDARPPPKPIRINRDELAPAGPMREFKFNGNLLILYVDALRADRMGISKYGRRLTPNLDRLTSQSVYFPNAYAQSNRTPHSFGAFLTSRYPTKIKWRRKRESMPRLAGENLTLFEVLKQAGYRNVAVTRHYYFKRLTNAHQGFDRKDWDHTPWLSVRDVLFDVAAPDVTKRAIEKLKQLKRYGKKFCLLVHYPDPHRWYIKHKGFPITQKGPARVVQKYDYEIAFADMHVGKVLKTLQDLDLHHNTAVVFFSDHGEAFGDHKYKGRKVFYHGQVLYEEMIHVPLAFRIPGISPRTVKDRVMLIDVAPTLLDMMKRPIPESFMGSSLIPYFFGRNLPARVIRAETLTYRFWDDPNVMMIKGRWKLHYRIRDNVFELYDLKNDPNERNNLAARHPDVVKRLKAEIRNY